MCKDLNMSDLRMFVNVCRYDVSEYTSVCNYGKVLNIPKILSMNSALWQGSEYA